MKKGGEPANYVFIGEGIYLDSADLNTLLNFAENGNNVFISNGFLFKDKFLLLLFLLRSGSLVLTPSCLSHTNELNLTRK